MTTRPLGFTTLITGASSGIGKAAAREFAAHGSDLLLLARDGSRLQDIGEELTREFGARVDILVQDVADGDGLRRALEDALARFEVQTAIINAGIGQYGAFAFSPWEHIETVLQTNLTGALIVARAVLPGMIARHGGSIVLVSSVLGRRAMQWNAVYSSTKFALSGFADALRLEVRQHGIHVGVVNPARTKSEFFHRMLYSHPQRKARSVPESTPDKVARAIYTAVRKRKREVTVSVGGKLFVFAGRHFPRLSDAILARAVPSPRIDENENVFPTRPL